MIPLPELKRHLDLDVDDDGPDQVLRDLEAAVVKAVEDATGHHFGAVQEFVEVHDGVGRSAAVTLANPVADLTEVKVRTAPTITWANATTVALADVEIEAKRTDSPTSGRRLYRVQNSWPKTGQRVIRVTYTAGYAAGSGGDGDVAAPPSIRQAVRAMIATLYRRRGREGVTSERLGSYSATFAEDLADEAGVGAALELYRSRSLL